MPLNIHAQFLSDEELSDAFELALASDNSLPDRKVFAQKTWHCFCTMCGAGACQRVPP